MVLWNSKTYSRGGERLEKAFKKYGINIKNSDGSFRMMVDVLEDMYLKLSGTEINYLFYEISEYEKDTNVFDNSRGRKYKGVE